MGWPPAPPAPKREIAKIAKSEKPRRPERAGAAKIGEKGKIMKTQKISTQGKFEIFANSEKIHEGFSTQCEIMFRDYCGWCLKNKAPREMQKSYNTAARGTDPKTYFTLTVTKMTDAEFTQATAKTVKTETPKFQVLLAKLAIEAKADAKTADAIRKALKEMFKAETK